MTKLILTTATITTGLVLFAFDIHQQDAAIVGYQTSCISQGISRLNIKFRSIDPFPTLGDVIRFDPPAAVVGDTISFMLDGTRQCYRINSYDGTNSVLTTGSTSLPNNISFEGIPLLNSYEIKHNNQEIVHVVTCGSVSSDHAREAGLKQNKHQLNIEVEYISPSDNSPHPLTR